MNKTHYRLVFNKLRGMLMAVAEHVASTCKSTQETKGKSSAPVLELKHVSFQQKLLAASLSMVFSSVTFAETM